MLFIERTSISSKDRSDRYQRIPQIFLIFLDTFMLIIFHSVFKFQTLKIADEYPDKRRKIENVYLDYVL